MAVRRKRVDVYLAPGQWTVHCEDVNVKTIVGSCVAVCLWDPGRRVGGVNHYLLATPRAGDSADARYGTIAMAGLIDAVCRAGGAPAALQAAVVGGGHPLHLTQVLAVGNDNVALALEVLATRQIRVVRQETGGTRGRKLLFNPYTGELIVRRLQGGTDRRLTGVKV